MSLAIANLSDILDKRGITAFQKRVVALCAAIAFVDGIEGQLAGYIAPALREDMGLSPSELGIFLAAGPLGLFFGGLFIAPLADRLGRRPILIACVTFFGICSLLTAMSSTLPMLDGFRVLTGVGVGAALANSIYDAVGVRIDEIPITPDKVLRALEKKQKGDAPRVGPESFPQVPYPAPTFVLPPWEGGDGNELKGQEGRKAA
jgi:hypothetical protein